MYTVSGKRGHSILSISLTNLDSLVIFGTNHLDTSVYHTKPLENLAQHCNIVMWGWRHIWWNCWNFYGGLHKSLLFPQEWSFSHSRSSKVIDFGTNRKRVCDFLLIGHSNFGPILQHFRDIAGFLCSWPHPYSILILGVSRVFALEQIATTGVKLRKCLSYSAVKLFSKYANLCDHSPPTSQTDRQTDDMQSLDCALHYSASRCKNYRGRYTTEA